MTKFWLMVVITFLGSNRLLIITSVNHWKCKRLRINQEWKL